MIDQVFERLEHGHVPLRLVVEFVIGFDGQLFALQEMMRLNMEQSTMENQSPHEFIEMEPQPHRRQLFKTALAVTAGGSLLALAAADAVAQPNSGVQAAAAKPSASRKSRMESPMQEAIDACLNCHSMCLRMATTFCLEQGGRHVEKRHLSLMLNCAELCQTSANFMLSDSPLHGRVCLICAEACEACAKSCEQVGDMRECFEECQSCARSCRTMT